MAATATEKNQEFRDARAAFKSGKILIAVLPTGRREIVQDIKTKGGSPSVETLAGWTHSYKQLLAFSEMKEAQDFLFNRKADKAA